MHIVDLANKDFFEVSSCLQNNTIYDQRRTCWGGGGDGMKSITVVFGQICNNKFVIF